MTRRRIDGSRRVTLAEAETIELRIGAPPDRQSLFVDAADRRDAAAIDAKLTEGRDLLIALIEAGPVLRELGRRHRLHWRPGLDNRDCPAVFLPTACATCNPLGWDLPEPTTPPLMSAALS